MPKNKKQQEEALELDAIKTLVRSKITDKYGSVAAFLKTDEAKKLGGRKIRCYLYNSGATNFKVLCNLCKMLEIGVLSKNTKRIITTIYSLSKV